MVNRKMAKSGLILSILGFTMGGYQVGRLEIEERNPSVVRYLELVGNNSQAKEATTQKTAREEASYMLENEPAVQEYIGDCTRTGYFGLVGVIGLGLSVLGLKRDRNA